MTKVLIISLIIALAMLGIYVIVVTHKPKSKEGPLTYEERAEIDVNISPYIEMIKRRNEATCRTCKYVDRDMDEEPCKYCLRPSGRNRYESQILQDDEIVDSYVQMLRGRSKQ